MSALWNFMVNKMNQKKCATALWNFMVRQFNQKKMRALTVEEMFVRVTPEKRTFIPQRRFSFLLLIICDNWIFIVFFNIKPIKQNNIKYVIV